ncbi:Hsp70 family protein [Asanoa sp. WMMD1127]|uniref:Hsp70 family protein n=1 Tax=Asanoa sp. WMMD1127 TaxID=3016107 RepID=UPI0024159AC4|nr:Hsp70 family protein [Asanoa sp. WMMD1127]MDG4826088.1 Hsp70 family protein [Asanoa sp. WMMD1127]
MRAVGIDFGTSHTVAVVAVDGAPARPLLFDGSPLLASAVYLDPGGRLAAGSDAVRAARLNPARFEPNPKRRVDEGEVLLGSTSVPVSSLVGAVLARVAAETRRWAGEEYAVVLTHPAGWSALRRGVLVEAAATAGLPSPVSLLPEPVAAARYFTTVLRGSLPVGAALAVYDLGAGTFDAAVVRRSPAGLEVLASHGLPDVGGLDLDQALVEHLGEAYSPSRTALWDSVLAPVDMEHRRQRALLYDDVRGTKEALSRSASADVHLPALEVAAHVTRDELERLARPMLTRTVDCLARTIADARLEEDDLVGVFLVGGSSRMPLVARLIHQELGIAPTAIEQPETVVAQGAVSVEPVARVPAQRGPSDRPVSATIPTQRVPMPPDPSTVPVGHAGPAVPAPPAPRPAANRAGLAWVVILSVLVAVAAVGLAILLLNG